MPRNIAALLLLPLTIACGQTATSDERAAAEGGTASAPPDGNGAAVQRGVVLFLGTSLTAGYGLGEEFAYPALIQQKIDSAGLPFRVENAGVSGETSAGGLARLDWHLQQRVDVLVLELGANDGLRGLPVDALRANLDSILTRTRRKYPDVELVILGMEAPRNLGGGYTTAFRSVYRELAQKHDAALVPFLLEGVALQSHLNIADGIHPNAAGHRRVAETVWGVLGGVLEG
jgi:acyl-CoA thioesterase-1